MTSSSDSSRLYTSTVQSGPPLLMLHSRPTLVFKLLFPCRPILYLLPLLHHYRLLLLAVSISPASSRPDSLRILQWNAGGLRARSAELLHFLSSHSVDCICIQESNLNSSSSFRIPGFSDLRSDRTHHQSGTFSPDATHTSGGVIIFVRHGLSCFELSTATLSSLDPCFDYIGVNISLNNSSSHLFLNVYAPLFAPLQRMAEPIPLLLPSIPPPEYSSFWGISIAISLFGTPEVFSTPVGRTYSIGSSLLTSSPSMTLICLLFYIASLAVAPPLTSPLLPPLSSYLAHGMCFKTSVLITYQFFYQSLSLRFFLHTSISRKLAGMVLLFPLTHTVFLQRNTRLFPFPLLLLSLLL